MMQSSTPKPNGLRRLRKWMHALRYTPLHPQFFAYRYERLRYQIAGLTCTGKVLDIGCGRQPLRAFLDADCEYIGLDYPQTGEPYETRPGIHGDAQSLPFPDGTFDTVVCLEVLEHVLNPDAALNEARRVLKPEGHLLLSTPFLYPIHDAPSDFRRWTAHGLEAMAQSSGLQVESLRTLGSPLESGALLLNLGLAWRATNGPLLWRLPLSLLALVSIPVTNLLGLLDSRISGSQYDNPFAIGFLGVFKTQSHRIGVPAERRRGSCETLTAVPPASPEPPWHSRCSSSPLSTACA
jgi:SAM-dependent methyltransferase